MYMSIQYIKLSYQAKKLSSNLCFLIDCHPSTSPRYEEKFFIVWRDGNVYYNELGTRVKLAKRRYKGKKRNKIKLVVKPRELLDPELQQMVIFILSSYS